MWHRHRSCAISASGSVHQNRGLVPSAFVPSGLCGRATIDMTFMKEVGGLATPLC